LFGFDAAQIFALQLDEAALHRELTFASEASAHWRSRGLAAAFQFLATSRSTLPRLAGLPQGERIITNYLHIVELLNDVERRRKLPPPALARWLENPPVDDADDQKVSALRLESEQGAVRIITMHKAKGLEFDVCFIPYAWTESGRKSKSGKRRVRSVATDADGYRRELDLRFEVQETAAGEDSSEDRRLLYVALTRSRHLCYVAVPEVAKLENSSIGALLALHDSNAVDAIERLVAMGQGTIACEILRDSNALYPSLAPASDAGELVPVRRFQGRIPSSRFLSSFSGIIHARIAEDDWVAELPEDKAELEAVEPEGIHAFPKGVQTGHFFHRVLDEMDFTNLEGIETLTSDRLRAAGLEPRLLNVSVAALRTIANSSLPDPSSPGTTIPIGTIERSGRLTEVQFHIPCRGVDLERIAKFFEERFRDDEGELAARRIRRLTQQEIEGYLTGYIDLIFAHEQRYYVLDWKTNWLGVDINAYGKQNVAVAMGAGSYYLQMMIYLVALENHLRATLGRDAAAAAMGGALYVFLRGLDPARPEHSVYAFHPTPDDLETFRLALGVARPAI
jgi:exodeoxyribonuclease V beta subunit